MRELLTEIGAKSDETTENSSLSADNMENSDVQGKRGNTAGAIIGLIIIIIVTSPYFFSLFSGSYYVAKLPGFAAGSVKVDGYMHKSKSCCERVAESFGAEVIKVKPGDTAGTNSLGQTVTYEDAFYYCRLCD